VRPGVDYVEFQEQPPEPGWYGVIHLAGGSTTRGVPLYWTGRDWKAYPTFPWFRSVRRFETADEAQRWLDALPR
jgi:hypothetical protein